jgi:hypothetical protein
MDQVPKLSNSEWYMLSPERFTNSVNNIFANFKYTNTKVRTNGIIDYLNLRHQKVKERNCNETVRCNWQLLFQDIGLT